MGYAVPFCSIDGNRTICNVVQYITVLVDFLSSDLLPTFVRLTWHTVHGPDMYDVYFGRPDPDPVQHGLDPMHFFAKENSIKTST